MTDQPRSLTFQRSCIEHLIALHSKDVENTIIQGAKQAALTIGWLERQAELLRMLDTLRKERPDLFAIMSECAAQFPGSKIADVPKVNGWKPHPWHDPQSEGICDGD